jgi:hypothetical protein
MDWDGAPMDHKKKVNMNWTGPERRKMRWLEIGYGSSAD